jgi:molybdenum-dependent DNA-binding transcriptional regulator ModE
LEEVGVERTPMSGKEFKRGAVLERVSQRKLSLKEASEVLGLSYRQAKRVYKRFREEGASGLVHRSVGRVSNHARAREERERVRIWCESTTAVPSSGDRGSGSGPRWRPIT